MNKVAALFVEKNGPYFNLENVVPYDEERDARKYKGPWPVVCHPPCQLWGRFAKINYKRWGGEHNKPFNDSGCFKSALRSVRKFGGVLEHPAYSYAFDFFKISKPFGNFWTRVGQNEWVCEVWQSAYGNKANKKTWLLYVGQQKPIELDFKKVIGSHQIGFYDQRGKNRNKPTISGKQASRTPQAFRDVLIKLAEMSQFKEPSE